LLVLLYAALSLLNDFFCDKAIIDKTLFDDIAGFIIEMYDTTYGIKRLITFLHLSQRCQSFFRLFKVSFSIDLLKDVNGPGDVLASFSGSLFSLVEKLQ
jgi:hypothetical protein